MDSLESRVQRTWRSWRTWSWRSAGECLAGFTGFEGNNWIYIYYPVCFLPLNTYIVHICIKLVFGIWNLIFECVSTFKLTVLVWFGLVCGNVECRNCVLVSFPRILNAPTLNTQYSILMYDVHNKFRLSLLLSLLLTRFILNK